MNKNIFVLLALIFVGAISCGEKKSGYDEGYKGKFLWKIESGKAKVYIFGVMQLGADDFYPVDSIVEKSFAGAEVFVKEMNTGPDSMKKMQMQTMIYNDGKSLKEHISDSLYTLIASTMDSLGLSVNYFQFHTPFAINGALHLNIQMRNGFDYSKSFDSYFSGKSDGKTLEYLYSVDDAISFINATQRECGEECWKFYFEKIPHYIDIVKGKAKAYKEGDYNSLLKYIEDEEAEYPSISGVNSKNRETVQKMVLDKIKNCLKTDKTYFIMLDVGGMLGDKGTIKYLENNGIQISEEL